MLLFEYGKRQFVEPTALVNDAPDIWRWTNPDLTEASWLFDVFGITGDVDSSNTYFYSGATFDNIIMSTVQSYVDLLATEFSFWWDNTNQIAYFHVWNGINPHSYDDLYLTLMFGATDGATQFLNNTLYPTILKNKPTITRSVEPVTYSKLATQSITIELQNDPICIVNDAGVPTFINRFDDLSDIVGQVTWFKYGADGSAYADLLTLHKGVIVDYELLPTSVSFIIDDFRSKIDTEWPTGTYEDLGYTDSKVGEDNATKVVPDGYGYNRQMPALCVTQDVDILTCDEDTDEILNLPFSLVPYDMTTWSVDGSEITKQNTTRAKFTQYRLGKTGTTANANVTHTVVATSSIHRFSGYIQYASQTGVTRLELYDATGSIARLDIDFALLTYVTVGLSNIRVKFIQEDDENTIAYFSFEYASFVIGTTYIFAIWIDVPASTDSACYCAGLKVTLPEYVLFKIASMLTEIHKVYYIQDDEPIEILSIPYIDLANGIIGLYECDAHTDGLMDGDIAEICVDGILRTPTEDRGIVFDGIDDYAIIPYASILHPTDELSISVFAYMEHWTVVSDTVDLVNTQQSGGYGVFMGIAGLVFAVWLNGAWFEITATSPLAEGWHHFVCTYDGRYTKIYVDNVLSVTGDAGADYPIVYSTLVPILLANDPDASGNPSNVNYFDGMLHRLTIYSSALTLTDIAELFLERTVETGLLGTWCVKEDDVTLVGALNTDVTSKLVNPFDIIKDLNYTVLGIPYIDSLYNIAVCEAEKQILAPIGLYKDSTEALSTVIEEIQGGSIIGFRYDDVDKIYIRVDNPNRAVSYWIQNGEIVNLDTLKIQGNLTLYSDVVTVQYNSNKRTNDTIDYTNDEYKRTVLRRYRYSNPKTFSSLLQTELEAYNKSRILLEDLSVARPIYLVKIHGLLILTVLDLYFIVKAHMELSETREYAGYQRVQITGIEVDTDYEMVTFTLRQRDYSNVVADIIGSPVELIGDSTIPEAIGDDTVPDILGTREV